ncbi:MAG: fused MFS/spermidine synthase, partial [Deltaproteobacteria bacterium]|nr:fused MFS/spermidine synthase [Deltaproteobacteria bacterium]
MRVFKRDAGECPPYRLRILLFALLAILSGIAGLIYETLWIRILSLGVGSTAASMSTVLSIFFLGLSVGSYAGGKLAARMRAPLLWYGVVEGALGIYSLLIIFPLFNFHQLLAGLPFAVEYGWVSSIGKYFLILILLVFPTVMMGATLPLLVKAVVKNDESVGKCISLLYGINTLGAAVGSCVTGFILIPIVGILYANFVGVGLNLLVLTLALIVSRKVLAEDTADFVRRVFSESKKVFQDKTIEFKNIPILMGCGVSGFSAIVCEVVWSKYLSIFLGTNVFGVALVLSMYLLGIAFGSFLLSLFIGSIAKRRELFATLLMVAAIASLVCSYALDQSPKLATFIHFYIPFSNLLLIKSVVCALILLIPTSIFGVIFPLGISTLIRNKEQASAVTGLAYSVNTLGSILGSYLAGMVLVPHLGSSPTIGLASGLSAAAAIWLMTASRSSVRSKVVYITALAIPVVVTAVFVQFDFKNLIKSAYHAKATSSAENSKLQLQEALLVYNKDYEDFKLIIEGETGIISLSHDPKDGAYYRQFFRLKTNGLNESIYNLQNPDELPKYEALIGLLPYLFSRNPKNAFVVGFGGGFTVDFLTETDLERVNVAELEKGILEAANYVYKGNHPVLARSNLKVKIEDARYVLASKSLVPQDIIVSQPSHSWLSGVANLFTQEFFQIAKDNLSDKGIFSQWLNLYNMDVPVLSSLLRTFFTVFPHGAVFTQLGDDELVLLGSKHPLDLNLHKLEQIAANPIFKKKLANVFVRSSYDVLSLFSLSRKDVLDLTQDAAFNTDRNAYAEVRQSALFYNGLQGNEAPQEYLSRVFRGNYTHLLNISAGKFPNFYFDLLSSLHLGGQHDKFAVMLKQYEDKRKDYRDDWWNLGYFCLKAQRFSSAKDYLEKALNVQQRVGILNLLLSSLTEMGKFDQVAKVAKSHPVLRDRVTDCYVSNAHLRSGKLATAEPLFVAMVGDIKGYTQECGDFFNKIVGD